MKQNLIRIVALILVVLMITSISSTTISYAVDELLNEKEIENQNLLTTNKSVEFDISYEDGKHTRQANLSDDEVGVNITINVKDAGYLKNAIVDFSESNFIIKEIRTPELIEKVEEKVMKLNRINGGDSITIKLFIAPDIKDEVAYNFFNKDNKIKFDATFVNEKSKESNAKKEVILHTSWKSENAELIVEQGIEKYVLITSNEEKGVLIQQDINTSVKDFVLPIKTSKIELSVPVIESELPEKVAVISADTQNTNAAKAEFGEKNWEYSKQEGILTINVENAVNNDGKIYWPKDNKKDEFKVIYRYSENVLNKIKDNGCQTKLQTKVTETLYGDEDSSVEKTDVQNISLNEQIGSVVNIDNEIVENKIDKGYLYSNRMSSETNTKDTVYNEKHIINISDVSLTSNMTIEDTDYFITGESGTKVASLVNNTRKISINKKQMEEVLGEAGYIEIKQLRDRTKNEYENVYIANGASETESDGNIEIDLSDIENKTIIQISKPENEGIITINSEKIVKDNNDVDIKSINKIESGAVLTLENGIPANIANDSIELVEPTAKAKLELSKDTFSTVSSNNWVEINAILETDSADDMLYENPVIQINLPKYIIDTKITNINLLYSEEVKIKSNNIIDTSAGKAIKIQLDGKQTQYNTKVEKGINIVIGLDLTIDRLTPSKQENIDLLFENKNDGNTYKVSSSMKFTAPVGLVTVNELSNYASNKDSILLVSGEKRENTAYIDAYANATIAKYKGKVINNYNNDISEVKILGTVPNKDIKENTFNMQLNGLIQTSGKEVTVYYSEVANADSNINNTANKWTNNVTDFSKIKSYLIIANTDLKQGENIDFEMNLAIPSNLAFKNKNEINYSVSFKNNTSVGSMNENKNGNNIVITTGEGPILEVELEMDEKTGKSLKQSQHANFTAKIKNTGSDATNVQLAIDETYGKVQELKENSFEFINVGNTIAVGDIKAGETKAINYILTIKNEVETGNQKFKIGVKADKINNPIIATKDVNIESGYVEMVNISAQNSKDNVNGGQEVAFVSIITNTSNEDLSDFNIIYKISNSSKIKSAGTKLSALSSVINEENITINENNNSASYKVESLRAGESIIMTATATAGHTSDKISAVVYTEGGKVGKNYSNVVSKNIDKYDAVINTESNSNKVEVFEGEEIEYIYTIQNSGNVDLKENYITAIIPNGAKFKKAQMSFKNSEKKIEIESANDKNMSIYCPKIGVGDKASLTIILETEAFSNEEIGNKVTEKELSMKIKFSSELIKDLESDPITYYVEYNKTRHDAIIKKYSDLEDAQKEHENSNNQSDKQKKEENKNGENGNNDKQGNKNNKQNIDKNDDNQNDEKDQNAQKITYRISGRVWLDSNKNAKQDSDENGIKEINVRLIDLSEMDFVKDSSGNDIVVKSEDDGSYKFENLKNGKYIVAFDYSNTYYNISQYKKEGVANTLNSDVIEKIVSIDGKEKTLGLTDTLEINNANIRNIDLGLSIASKFDIELTKRVSKITVNNEKGIEDYNYTAQPKSLGKVEIKDKYLNSSTVIIEYTIRVENKGDVKGYVRSIVDYIPDELKFSSELNKDWYLGTDGNAYNMSLANVELKPGESKEVKIILSKKMTENNIGLVNNDAEIFDAYNVEGIKNINAKPGNKNKSENDMSTAGMVVSVKTGETVAKYTALIVVVIAILVSGIYMIKVKILDKRI